MDFREMTQSRSNNTSVWADMVAGAIRLHNPHFDATGQAQGDQRDVVTILTHLQHALAVCLETLSAKPLQGLDKELRALANDADNLLAQPTMACAGHAQGPGKGCKLAVAVTCYNNPPITQPGQRGIHKVFSRLLGGRILRITLQTCQPGCLK
jgi:hypothetical protein